MAYSLIWGLGLAVSLFISNPKVSKENIVIYNLVNIYTIFLFELFITFEDIGFKYEERAFNSNIFKLLGYLILNICITITSGLFYVFTDYKNISLLILGLFMCGLKYMTGYISRNPEDYMYIREESLTSNIIRL